VDVRLTDADDVVSVERAASGNVRITAAATADAEPHFARTFVADETEEVRIYLGGNDDRVGLGGGRAGAGPLVRVIGGTGDDMFELRERDSLVRLYDSQGDDVALGEDPPTIDRGRFDEWVWTEEDRDQPRDWGRRTLPIFWSGYGSDVGMFVGAGVQLQTYGFRKRPFGGQFDFRGGVAPQIGKWRVQIEGRANGEGSPLFATFGTRVSRLDVIHYYGLGNDAARAGDRAFHRVDQTAASARVGLGLSMGPGWELAAGVVVERLSTRSGTGRFYGSLGPVYGGGRFVQLSGVGRLHADPLADSERTAHRVRLDVEGQLFPALFDAERGFGKVAAEVSALFAPSPSPRVSLALRASGEEVWGRFPWHEAAFIGGPGSLAGWDEQRFAGDVAVSGAAELRLRLWRPRIVVPVSLGLLGFADAGRVYLDGASPGGWHTTVGGGVWLRPVLQPYIVRAGVGRGAEATKLFVTLGLPY
jgi:hypothetical protein